MTRRGKRPRPGALGVLALLFLTSGLLRLGAEAGQAIAREQADPEMGAAEVPEGCRTSEDVKAAIDMLAGREERIATLEAQIADRMQALAVADREIAARLGELESAEEELRNLLTIADEAAEGDLARLTSVYETMKAKEAAALFAEMEPEFAAGFLGRMRPEAAAGIMAGLDPQTAYTISVLLAGRNAGAPKE
jgi:flagellar motility protein MotE (MotC chaperone)